MVPGNPTMTMKPCSDVFGISILRVREMSIIKVDLCMVRFVRALGHTSCETTATGCDDMSEPVKKSSSIVAIFSEFMTSYPMHFGLLFLFLVVEGTAAAMSVMAIVPMADFLLDSSLGQP